MSYNEFNSIQSFDIYTIIIIRRHQISSENRYQYHQRFRSRLTAKRIRCSNSFTVLATEQTFAPGELHIQGGIIIRGFH